MRWIAILLLFTGCDSSGGGIVAPADLADPPDLAPWCGHPGDTGNSLGVGKYCQTNADCSGPYGLACSTPIRFSKPYNGAEICTKTCNPSAPISGGPCGPGATCCNGHESLGEACVCWPNSCLQ